jgi:hypothetical protein
MKKVFIMSIVLISVLWLIEVTQMSDLDEKYFANNLYIKGKILNSKISDNHCFGIILVKIDSINQKWENLTFNKKIFPVFVRDSLVEYYCPIYENRKVGQTLEMILKNKSIYKRDSNNNIFSFSDIYFVSSCNNISFIKNNSLLQELQ